MNALKAIALLVLALAAAWLAWSRSTPAPPEVAPGPEARQAPEPERPPDWLRPPGR